MLRHRPIISTSLRISLLLWPLLSISVAAQSWPHFPRQIRRVPLTTYINDAHAFDLSYPTSYHRDSRLPEHLADRAEREKWQVLLYATIGTGKAQCEDSGDCDKFGSLIVVLDSRHFDFETIGEHYEHMGWVQPVPFRVGSQTFYYIGPGGGGVNYPDTFFYNLRGRILVIEFDGPYPLDSTSKSPSGETKKFEKAVLDSFRLRSQSEPHK